MSLWEVRLINQTQKVTVRAEILMFDPSGSLVFRNGLALVEAFGPHAWESVRGAS